MKNINFKYGNNTYTLTFTAQTVKQLESAGFDVDEYGSKPVTNTEMLFHGAFLANHPNISDDLVQEIWDNMPRKREVLRALIELYNAPVAELFDEPTSGEIEWKVSE